MEKKQTKTRTIRIPIELDERISNLATKQLWSVNKWILHNLERGAKPK